MTLLLDHTTAKLPLEIATQLSKEFAVTAVDRDRQAGIPQEEVRRLRESGLLSLVIPKQYGGQGATWPEAFQVLQTLAKADGSLGQLFANHLILPAAVQAVGTPTQASYYCTLTAQHGLFWGNAVNTRDIRLQITAEGDRFRVNGVKSFGTGVAAADLRLFSAMPEGAAMPMFFVLPRDRAGITYNNDWENMGQRRTASGSFTFENVVVYQDEILGPPTQPEGAFAGFINVVVQLTKAYVYLGIATGALEAAMEYTTVATRPWMTAGVDRATQDPYILQHYGEFWMQLQAAQALADQTAQKVQQAWSKGNALTQAERGEVAIAIASTKAFVARTGLDITNRIFEVMGARSTAARYGFDRYWRDLRTFTLHDPLDYKLREIGNWLLNHEYPTPSQYS